MALAVAFTWTHEQKREKKTFFLSFFSLFYFCVCVVVHSPFSLSLSVFLFPVLAVVEGFSLSALWRLLSTTCALFDSGPTGASCNSAFVWLSSLSPRLSLFIRFVVFNRADINFVEC